MPNLFSICRFCRDRLYASAKSSCSRPRVHHKNRAKKSRWVQDGEVEIKSYELKPLKKFWSDSILVIVVPEGIYAQGISNLKIQENGHQRLSDFKEFQEFFPQVSSDTFSYFKDIALRILQVFNPKKEKSE